LIGRTGIERALLAAAALALGGALSSSAPAQAPEPPTNPTNQSEPQIQGSEPRQEGQRLTASEGSWTPPQGTSLRYEYRWFRCGAGGSGCDPIAGANTKSYTLTTADVGSRLRVRVSAICQVETATGQAQDVPNCGSSADSNPTGGVLPDPYNENRPDITGTAQVGSLLSASAGFWRSVASLGFDYRWRRCNQDGENCSGIAGASHADYRVTRDDVGRRLRVAVTAENSRPRAATALSRPTAVVTALPTRRGQSARLLSPFPTIVMAGVVARSGARISEFSIVRAPRRALVTVRCLGRGCPFHRKRLRVRSRRVRIRALERRLRPGLVIGVRITKGNRIGKYSRFRIRRNRVPTRLDRCLRPGTSRPSRCPRR
jgi:hypothetical protein